MRIWWLGTAMRLETRDLKSEMAKQQSMKCRKLCTMNYSHHAQCIVYVVLHSEIAPPYGQSTRFAGTQRIGLLWACNENNF